MWINDEITNKILEAAKNSFSKVVEAEVTLEKKGSSHQAKCPGCKEDKKLSVNIKKGIFKCFKCGFAGGGNNPALDFLMKKGMDYNQALQRLAEILNIDIPEETPSGKSTQKAPAGKKDYLHRFLAESGLTPEDVKRTFKKEDEEHTVSISHIFQKGTMDGLGNITKDGDDVIICYYDLDSNPVKYPLTRRNGVPTGKYKEFYRVRFQFPEEHKDKYGNPVKYKSPYKSGNHLYIPNRIAQMYQAGEKINRLYIQEGEKKAEKACKHGIPSVGIAGINNLGTKDARLPEDIVKIIQKCEVKEVVLMFDSDWNDLSSKININTDVSKRPRNFFYAAQNYRDYMRQLRNRNIALEIYIGHVLKNENKDKGIDDLLTNTLKGKEELLVKDIDYLVNEVTLKGEFVRFHKITTLSGSKIEELWGLQNVQTFADRHKDILKSLTEFRFGKNSWRFDEKGELINAQPLSDDEKYWNTNVKTKESGEIVKTTYEFVYSNCYQFLQNKGFGRYSGLCPGTFKFIHVDHPTVRVVETHEIRDYVIDFTKELGEKQVLEMLFRGGNQYLGPDKLAYLPYMNVSFEPADTYSQLFYFKDSCWEIRKDSIKEIPYTEIKHHIWQDQKKEILAQRVKIPLIKVVRDEFGKFDYTLSKSGEACHFLQFLINTSNFTWRQDPAEVKPEELQENKHHLIAKLCAIGYMIMTCKDRNVAKTVVGMDGRQSEVGKSNGRSGKSLIGELFKQILPTVYINGKNKAIEDDSFVWDEINEKTKIVFIDDVRTHFSLEFLFANITGDWAVNYKGARRTTIPFNLSPKIYITTNHALNGEGSSFTDRQWQIAFSDFYNDNHKPKDDFGVLFFDQWDFEQWNLLWNLLAECVQLYLTFGVIESPSERLELRHLRQAMGESFLEWAEAFFSASKNIGVPHKRNDLRDNFLETAPTQRKSYTPQNFRHRIQCFCKYKGWKLNPQKYDRVTGLPLKVDENGNPDFRDKSGGVEYFTLGPLNPKEEPKEEEKDKEPKLPFDSKQEGDYEF